MSLRLASDAGAGSSRLAVSRLPERRDWREFTEKVDRLPKERRWAYVDILHDTLVHVAEDYDIALIDFPGS